GIVGEVRDPAERDRDLVGRREPEVPPRPAVVAHVRGVDAALHDMRAGRERREDRAPAAGLLERHTRAGVALEVADPAVARDHDLVAGRPALHAGGLAALPVQAVDTALHVVDTARA